MLRLDSVHQSYGERRVLHDVSLTVPDGQLLCVVGPSGCGKSTLLRTIAGLLPVRAGTVTVDGTPVTGVPDRLAVVFQDYGRSLLPWLTVRDNVALPLRRRGLRRADRRAEAERILERVGLEGSARQHPWQLSGGMQQRVAIARALVVRPSLLLMDEPFGSLDAQTREDLEDLLLEVHRTDGTTIVFVTHDIDESVYVGDRVVALSPGPGARVALDLPVGLPVKRDQIATRGLPEFVALRAEVGRAVRTPGRL
ncbi:ATP-binding cassette domain-containing protein [Streptomyces sp. SID8379]|uniref:ABC transporter ATP-binding protein n=1 Tax=unclassified Streptomyces TaxID=2593676 RepID=UPI00036C053C|nr:MULTISPECIES: ABC transporter ATP-binding protein [unclassified Streptomyces]MYW62956.1 ATP-binding cassette domain-containing protein [Streptomyces sp. SID8379]